MAFKVLWESLVSIPSTPSSSAQALRGGALPRRAQVCYGCCELKKRMNWDDTLDVWGVHGCGGSAAAPVAILRLVPRVAIRVYHNVEAFLASYCTLNVSMSKRFLQVIVLHSSNIVPMSCGTRVRVL